VVEVLDRLLQDQVTEAPGKRGAPLEHTRTAFTRNGGALGNFCFRADAEAYSGDVSIEERDERLAMLDGDRCHERLQV
jgi:hypothetical protein